MYICDALIAHFMCLGVVSLKVLFGANVDIMIKRLSKILSRPANFLYLSFQQGNLQFSIGFIVFIKHYRKGEYFSSSRKIERYR